jgi:hypothetical protein
MSEIVDFDRLSKANRSLVVRPKKCTGKVGEDGWLRDRDGINKQIGSPRNVQLSDCDISLPLSLDISPASKECGNASKDGGNESGASCDCADPSYLLIVSALASPMVSLCGAMLFFRGLYIFRRDGSDWSAGMIMLGTFFSLPFVVYCVVQH